MCGREHGPQTVRISAEATSRRAKLRSKHRRRALTFIHAYPTLARSGRGLLGRVDSLIPRYSRPRQAFKPEPCLALFHELQSRRTSMASAKIPRKGALAFRNTIFWGTAEARPLLSCEGLLLGPRGRRWPSPSSLSQPHAQKLGGPSRLSRHRLKCGTDDAVLVTGR